MPERFMPKAIEYHIKCDTMALSVILVANEDDFGNILATRFRSAVAVAF
jgi:hypothetical protein